MQILGTGPDDKRFAAWCEVWAASQRDRPPDELPRRRATSSPWDAASSRRAARWTAPTAPRSPVRTRTRCGHSGHSADDPLPLAGRHQCDRRSTIRLKCPASWHPSGCPGKRRASLALDRNCEGMEESSGRLTERILPRSLALRRPLPGRSRKARWFGRPQPRRSIRLL